MVPMIALATWLAIIASTQNEPPPNGAKAPEAEVAKKGETEEERLARIGAGRVLFKDLTLLAILSILIMTLGALMLVSRMAKRIKNQKKAKPVKYFDMTVGDGPEPPPHEPTAEERLGGNR
jgi:hypothetical protein